MNNFLSRDPKIVILSFIDIDEIDKFKRVCKEWFNLFKNNQLLYKLKCERLWKISISVSFVKDWKFEYKNISNFFDI
jgi:hypothetical protein